MDMGPRTDERAALEAMIEAAAPGPVPAEHALALLRRLEEMDPATLGRLAYHALTGIDPGDGDPEPPSVVAPGFPPFAAEVLMRAICGPDQRRPTTQALLIVLDTVPPASWPAPRVAAPEVVPEPESEPEQATEPEPASELESEPEPDTEPEAAAAAAPPTHASRDEMHDEFRSLLNPTRPVPRFEPPTDPLSDPLDDPLTAPWEPDAAQTEPERLASESSSESAQEETDEESGADAGIEGPLSEAAPSKTEPTDGADSDSGMHDEFRAFVSPSFAVPRFEPLEGELPVGSERVRRRRGGRPSRRDRRRRAEETQEPAVEPAVEPETLIEETPAEEPTPEMPEVEEPPVETPEIDQTDQTDEINEINESDESDESAEATDASETPAEPSARRRGRLGRKDRGPRERHTVAHSASDGDRMQTLILVAVILVLIVLGVVYAASRDAESTDDPAAPQGANRSMSQPAPAAE